MSHFVNETVNLLLFKFKYLDVDLLGVCPENCIKYPRVNKTIDDDEELTAGHTHLFLMN